MDPVAELLAGFGAFMIGWLAMSLARKLFRAAVERRVQERLRNRPRQ